ncbi:MULTISPECIES: helix-turn-helix transcriptional regulator [unclassified Streptomyces]|uniref:helix-turn-helix domain-containing protein n=1 Tax=unclassified Streptomyces TaxID=2593676 RepID=UPI0015E15FB0|nr:MULTISPECIES: helix-turn-helix transcriptional regulator [unclassified Streptomyces]
MDITTSASGSAMRRSARLVSWRWATPEAQAVLATRNLASILKYYRRVHGISQLQTGDLLGYDKTYVSALELGKRQLSDVGSLRHVAERLALPAHVLGVTDPDDTDHRAMVQFGASTVRLAEVARQCGHAAEAVAELWPLVARLEARARGGSTERDVLRLLADARLSLGTALGNVMPEERLATAAHWTAKSLDVVRAFDDRALTTTALRMHGNELRKAGLLGAAVDRLTQAAATAADAEQRAAVLPLLARAAGALGNAALFDHTVREAHQLLDRVQHTSLVNPSALYQIRLRGLVSTGRTRDAIRHAESAPPAPTIAVAPQWRVIELITTGRVRLLAGDSHGATQLLASAVREAQAQRLPHQLQRVQRTTAGALPDTHDAATHALRQLRVEIAA